jgi:prepilin peptidase CpaA
MGLLAAGAACDLKSREIPNWIPLTVLAAAVGGTTFGWSPVGWVSLAAGLALGLGLGMLLWWRGGFGGGDVKMLAALGAVVGPRDLFVLLFYIAVVGVVLAIVALRRGQREIAYVPAMALGFLIFLITSEVL